MDPGSGMLLYTDGVTEGLNQTGEVYGHYRLQEVIRGCVDTPVDKACSAVLEDLERFVGEEAQLDDIALVAVKRENYS